MISPHLLAQSLGGEIKGDQVLAPGPNHNPIDRSMSVKVDAAAQDGFTVHSFAGDDWRTCRDYVKAKMGMPGYQKPDNSHSEFFRKSERAADKSKPDENSASVPQASTPPAEYIYHDEHGEPVQKVIRTADKQFPQAAWKDGRWISSMKGVTRVPYALPEMLQAVHDTVFVVEGEKDADTLLRAGFIATTNPQGAGKWTAGLNKWFAEKTVYILPDNDQVGRDHAQKVAEHLHPIAREIRIVGLDGLPDKGDVTDWLEADPSRTAGLIDYCHSHPLWTPQPANNRKEAPVNLIKADSIVPESVSWLWQGWLAKGKLHILAGAPGTGKTTIAIRLAATVSSGGRWPDGTRSPVGNVIIWSGEDGIADTLVPRLIAAGANRDRCFFVGNTSDKEGDRPFDPALDMPALRHAIDRAGGASLLVVDPVVSSVGGDSHKNAEVRRGLQPLVDLAQDIDCALLGITHFSKATAGKDPVERINGSIAFGAVSRIVFVAAKEEPNENDDGPKPGRIFVRAKSNLGLDNGGVKYDLEQGPIEGFPEIIGSAVVFGEAIEGDAKAMLATAETPESADGGALGEARDFLIDLLAAGPVLAKQCLAEARDAGLATKTLKRAKKELNVLSRKSAMAEGWEWFFPEGGQENPKGAIQNSMTPFGKVGPLRGSDDETPDIVEVEI